MEVTRLAEAIREPYATLVCLWPTTDRAGARPPPSGGGGSTWTAPDRDRRVGDGGRQQAPPRSAEELAAPHDRHPGLPPRSPRGAPGPRPPDPDALVFADGNGSYLRHSNFRCRIWLPPLAKAGLPGDVRIHDPRHTCAALLIARGAHPRAIQVHLGHSSIQVTMDRRSTCSPRSGAGSRRAWTRRTARRRRGTSLGTSRTTRRSSRSRRAQSTRQASRGAGRARTSDRRIMSPLL